MPTYEYECEGCGHRLSEFQRMSDAPLSTCPRCGGRLRRLVSGGAAILFKGGHGTSGSASCDRSSPCCGRTEPCETKPCE
ncbi:MAG: hypothetical protein AMJ84_05965 [Acidithiobacillales bacterium SM23_46]|nr:MAG: hypothetical protein AMJ84_05965 [Acidithiobacillales bacterium SM23_46]